MGEVPVSFVLGDRVSVWLEDAGRRDGVVVWRRLLRKEATGETRELFAVELADGSVVQGVPAGRLTARAWGPGEREAAACELVDRVAGWSYGPAEGSVADAGQRREAARLWVAICELLRARGLAFGPGGKVDVPEDLVRLCVEAILDRDVPTPLEEVDEGPEWLF